MMTIFLILYAVVSIIIAIVVSILAGGLMRADDLIPYITIWLYTVVFWPVGLIYFLAIMIVNRISAPKETEND